MGGSDARLEDHRTQTEGSPEFIGNWVKVDAKQTGKTDRGGRLGQRYWANSSRSNGSCNISCQPRTRVRQRSTGLCETRRRAGPVTGANWHRSPSGATARTAREIDRCPKGFQRGGEDRFVVDSRSRMKTDMRKQPLGTCCPARTPLIGDGPFAGGIAAQSRGGPCVAADWPATHSQVAGSPHPRLGFGSPEGVNRTQPCGIGACRRPVRLKPVLANTRGDRFSERAVSPAIATR